MKNKFFAFILAASLLCGASPAFADQVSAVQEYQRARTYVSGKHWKEAVPYLERALKIDPGYADALYMTAICYMSMDQLDKAVPLLKRLTNLRPDFVNGWGLLSQCYVQLKQLDNARNAIGELSKAVGGGPESRYMMGVLNWIEGNLEGAEKEWREAIRLRPEMAKAHYNLGILLKTKGDRVRAQASLQDALRYNPDNFMYRFSLGVLQYEMGNKIGAAGHLDKVRAQLERVDLSSAALAYQMFINKRWEGAEKAAKRAYTENPDLTDAYVIRGQALMQLGNEKEAKIMFTEALKHDRNVVEAQRALKGIEAKEKAEAKAKAEAEAKAKAEAEAKARAEAAAKGGAEGEKEAGSGDQAVPAVRNETSDVKASESPAGAAENTEKPASGSASDQNIKAE